MSFAKWMTLVVHDATTSKLPVPWINLRVEGSLTVVGSMTTSGVNVDLNADFIAGAPTEDCALRVVRGDEDHAMVAWDEGVTRWQAGTSSDGTVASMVLGTFACGPLVASTGAFSGVILGPNGAVGAPTYSYSAAATHGWYFNPASGSVLSHGGAEALGTRTGGMALISSAFFGWTSGDIAQGIDLAIKRNAAAVLEITDGASGAGALVLGTLKVGADQVVGARDTGWTAITGTVLQGGWATATATLDDALQTLKAMWDALSGHGLVGA